VPSLGLGLDSKIIQVLKKDYKGIKSFGDDQYIQNVVDDAILSLLLILLGSKIIKTFDLEDASQHFSFRLEKIEKAMVYDQLLAKMNGFPSHWNSSFGVLESKLKKLERFSLIRPLFNHLTIFK
jgi:hypothetical protein